MRNDKWQIFGYGVSDFDLIEQLVNNAIGRKEYWVEMRVGEESLA